MPKAAEPKLSRWRLWLRIFAWAAVGVTTAAAAHEVRQFAYLDPRFTLRDAVAHDPSGNGILIEGAKFASRPRIEQIFTADFNRSIFRIPLSERRRRLLAVDWIEDATVARVWPNRLIIRIRERTPVAFVRLPAGFLLIDAHGVLLSPPRTRFTVPVVTGIKPEQAESDRAARVQAALRLIKDLGSAAANVSEVDAAAPDDLRAVVNLNGHAVDLYLGDQNYGSRYRNFASHYEEIHRRNEQVATFDLRLDDRIIAK